MIGEKGVKKIYQLFSHSKTSDIRKLAGRLLCEATFSNINN